MSEHNSRLLVGCQNSACPLDLGEDFRSLLLPDISSRGKVAVGQIGFNGREDEGQAFLSRQS